jgi:hypothetical protein
MNPCAFCSRAFDGDLGCRCHLHSYLSDLVSDPNVEWALIKDPCKFLRTRTGASAQKVLARPATWVSRQEPDKQATITFVTHYLQRHKVIGMAAPGVDGCGEPCGCGGRASKHITGHACDVHGLPDLAMRIFASTPGRYRNPDEALDELLHYYHLWRPLAYLKGKSREDWHLEALPPHHSHQKVHHHAHSSHAHGC